MLADSIVADMGFGKQRRGVGSGSPVIGTSGFEDLQTVFVIETIKTKSNQEALDRLVRKVPGFDLICPRLLRDL